MLNDGEMGKLTIYREYRVSFNDLTTYLDLGDTNSVVKPEAHSLPEFMGLALPLFVEAKGARPGRVLGIWGGCESEA